MLNCAHLESERKGVVASRPSFARYAIYFTPQPGTALASFGRSWFGRANDGATLQAFSDAGFAGTGFAKVAAVPGRYTGLHALFKAPFVLREGIALDALKSRLDQLRRTAQTRRNRSADTRACRALSRASPGRADAAARVACRAMRRRLRRFRRTHDRRPTARRMRAPISATISACCWRASAIPSC